MGIFAFFLLTTVTCLLWAAACVATATRMERRLWRWLLVALGVILPIVLLLPWLWVAGLLAFSTHHRPNWFGSILTIVLSALVGGTSIAIGGLSRPRGTALARGACWPVIGLFALALIAKATTFGTLLILDNAVAAEARSMRVEAAAIMEAALPPAVADIDNAARLHLEAGAAIAAAPDLTAADGILTEIQPELSSQAVTDVLLRHAALLDTIRRAADLPGCRFPRDWSRPSYTMPLSEIHSARTEARLLALAARREAAAGRHAEALADAVRLGRIGRQIGSEPILTPYVVGSTIDALALAVIADILPQLAPEDAGLLDEPALRDLIGSTPTPGRAIQGEEALGLALFADFADGRGELDDLSHLSGSSNVAAPEAVAPLLSLPSALWRVFLLPSDIAGYRRRFYHARQIIAGSADLSMPWPELRKALDGTEKALRRLEPEGIITGLINPAIGSVLQVQSQATARHRAASMLLAATRQRLAAGALPDSIDALVPGRLPVVPLDPFTEHSPMRLAIDSGDLVVWSVGPDGNDDGGPQRADDERNPENDDIGLRMPGGARSAESADRPSVPIP